MAKRKASVVPTYWVEMNENPDTSSTWLLMLCPWRTETDAAARVEALIAKDEERGKRRAYRIVSK